MNFPQSMYVAQYNYAARMNFPQSMYVAQYNYAARRLLQAPAVPPPPPSSNGTNSSPPSSSSSSSDQLDANNSLNMGSHFSPSMAIILVVLLSAFFFMGFFSVYVRRCSTDDDLGGEGDNGGGGGAGGGNQRQEQVGLDPAMVANLPMVAYNSAAKKKGCTECVVCLSEFEEGEPLRMLPKCKHVFHPDCIDMWLYSHTTCPLCRRSLLASASRSFRWGSSRRGSFNDGSTRSGGGSMRGGSTRGADAQQMDGGSTAATTPTSAPEIQLVVTEGGSRRGDRGEGGLVGEKSDRERRLPWLRRSHSTGHALRRVMSRAGLFGGASVTPPAACSTVLLTPPAGLHRSRSVAGPMAGACPEAESSSTADGRPPRPPAAWSSSLKRAISLTRLPVGIPSPPAAAFAAPVGQASRSSSGRRTFERLTA